MTAFKLGFLTHVHGPGKDSTTVLRELLDVFAAADELGFDGGWVAQHHFRDDFGRLPSPLVFFGAAAARAPRLRLGTAVTVLPLEDPLRLAEDAAVLDAFSGGALELGLGTGGANHEAFSAFGHDPGRRRELFDDRLTVLKAALRGDPLPGGDLVLQPPVPALADRIWQSTSDNARAAQIGAHGDGLLLGTAVHDPETVQKPLAEAYLTTAVRPRFGIVRAVFPAKDRQAAQDDLAPALAIHRTGFVGHGLTELVDLPVDDYLARINVHHGTPAEVVASLRADPALLGYLNPDSWFLPVVQHELSDPGADVERLRVIAEEIAPALGWRR
ncbi:LLM class flavin-dependent oxidoreductase [Kibdelosporangium phytohabitans]|uniref:Monooxygenase n=1 Tax=Kibdelosporangium phytohabitans TaxID=860235 RepID=A0A0N9HX90_9PSEU|nr:LLM class flavin-dependent oxidoreductase [Kibdelosporangium phytohabitans]ALG09918.1 monooxygenase [Kibdelosporangium phytohabitans]MBE1468676.1 alkanesulfonate monooxygenase SsuD/methylene tetrahydromethanopterin reductase-like flavin-dependent oxidoreductase (luciferase family) [Kibdelosporangium phytohabitans]